MKILKKISVFFFTMTMLLHGQDVVLQVPTLDYLPKNITRPAKMQVGAGGAFAKKATVFRLGEQRQRTESKVEVVLGAEALKISGTLTTGDKSLPWRLFVPTLSKDGKYPMIVFLHGLGEAGDDNKAQFKNPEFLLFVQAAMQKKFPCFVLAPQHPKGESWGSPVVEQPRLHLRMTLALIDRLKDRYPIDLTRVYVIGLSSGAAGVVDCITLYPDVFAAGIAISNAHGSPFMVNARGRKPSPVWFSLNEGEETAIIENAKHLPDALARWGTEVRVSIAKDRAGHASWQWCLFQPELPQWLFSQRISKETLWTSVSR